MNKENIYRWFSEQRFQKFERHFDGNLVRAEHLYKVNIQLSEALYPIMSVFEVCLWNKIHQRLTKFYGTDEWYVEFRTQPKLASFTNRIEDTIEKIERRKELVNPGKLVAELTLGFWVSLFNAEYERILWKPLRLCFTQLEKAQRQRKTVSANLNKIRTLRNRVYHCEPICWNYEGLQANYLRTIETLNWMDDSIVSWIEDIDQFQEVFNEITN